MGNCFIDVKTIILEKIDYDKFNQINVKATNRSGKIYPFDTYFKKNCVLINYDNVR